MYVSYRLSMNPAHRTMLMLLKCSTIARVKSKYSISLIMKKVIYGFNASSEIIIYSVGEVTKNAFQIQLHE